MSHPFDATTKYLIGDRLPDWLALSSRRADGPVTVIDSDLATVTAAADRVLRIDGPEPWLLHLEPHTYRDPTLPARLNMYGAILEHRHEALVWHVVVLLRREADHAALTGLWERRFGAEAAYRTFHYQVVRVWQLPAEAFLEGGLGVAPLAILTDEAHRGHRGRADPGSPTGRPGSRGGQVRPCGRTDLCSPRRTDGPGPSAPAPATAAAGRQLGRAPRRPLIPLAHFAWALPSLACSGDGPKSVSCAAAR